MGVDLCVINMQTVSYLSTRDWADLARDCVYFYVFGAEQDVRWTLVVLLLQLHECDWHNRLTHPPADRQTDGRARCPHVAAE